MTTDIEGGKTPRRNLESCLADAEMRASVFLSLDKKWETCYIAPRNLNN